MCVCERERERERERGGGDSVGGYMRICVRVAGMYACVCVCAGGWVGGGVYIYVCWGGNSYVCGVSEFPSSRV